MVPNCQNDIWLYEVLYISICQMPYLAPTPNNPDPLLTQRITYDFDLHLVQVVNEDTVSGTILAAAAR